VLEIIEAIPKFAIGLGVVNETWSCGWRLNLRNQ